MDKNKTKRESGKKHGNFFEGSREKEGKGEKKDKGFAIVFIPPKRFSEAAEELKKINE